MRVYEKPNGTRFVLASHTPAEWAETLRARLLALGVSEPYVEAVCQSYAAATAP